MKKILFFLIFFSSLLSAQNLYFSEPTSSHIDYIGTNGLGPIAYSMYLANGWQGITWKAMLKDPDGIETNWMEGQTGGWWVSKAGTYQIKGECYAYLIVFGQYYTLERPYFSFSVVDNYAPGVPQNLDYDVSANNHPLLEWDENTEYDMDVYKIYKKYTQAGGFGYLATTSNNYYEDETETFPLKGGPGETHNVWYYVKAVDINLNVSTASSTLTVNVAGAQIEKRGYTSSVMETFELVHNYPNPFNPSTQISYSLAEGSDVTLKVYDMLGTEVANLVNETQSTGNHTINFNASDLSSGVYIYRLTASKNGRVLFTKSKQMMLVK